MQTKFSAELLATDAGSRANDILRSCVHCGFCNATCPTYQVTGDELDGPRGRIYLMREFLEGGGEGDPDPARVTRHLDRCLTCRACETTCPSGVAYGELAEIARNKIGAKRTGWVGLLRRLLPMVVTQAGRLRFFSRLGRPFRWAIPEVLSVHIPSEIGRAVESTTKQSRQVLLLNGCAQQVSTAQTNEHLVSLLVAHEVAVQAVPDEGCCGSMELHLGDEGAALDRVRRNVDRLYPRLAEVEAVISTASGCGVTVKDYGRLLAHDTQYAEEAAAVAAATLDVSEYLAGSGLGLSASKPGSRVAWHAPCTLQHGQQVVDVVEGLLTDAGYELCRVQDAHLCCGSAGTYSILEPDLSDQLRTNKLAALTEDQPDVIASANVGCQTHLANGASIPVLHWIELLK